MPMNLFVSRVSHPVGAVLLLTGCFHYVPANPPPLPGPQTEVRITLREPIDISMGEFTLHSVTRIEGIVTEAAGDTVDLVARWLHPRVGQKYDAMLGSYAIPVSGIQQLEKWRFAGRRTAVAAGAILVTSLFLLDVVSRATGGGGILPIDGDAQSIMAPR